MFPLQCIFSAANEKNSYIVKTFSDRRFFFCKISSLLHPRRPAAKVMLLLQRLQRCLPLATAFPVPASSATIVVSASPHSADSSRGLYRRPRQPPPYGMPSPSPLIPRRPPRSSSSSRRASHGPWLPGDSIIVFPRRKYLQNVKIFRISTPVVDCCFFFYELTSCPTIRRSSSVSESIAILSRPAVPSAGGTG